MLDYGLLPVFLWSDSWTTLTAKSKMPGVYYAAKVLPNKQVLHNVIVQNLSSGLGAGIVPSGMVHGKLVAANSAHVESHWTFWEEEKLLEAGINPVVVRTTPTTGSPGLFVWGDRFVTRDGRVETMVTPHNGKVNNNLLQLLNFGVVVGGQTKIR